MSTHSEGFHILIGNNDDPQVFTELAVLEPPEMFTAQIATYARRTTKDTGKTKVYGLGLEDGEELALMAERDFEDPAQTLLRSAFAARLPIDVRFTFTDGTTTEEDTASFLITSAPVTPTDPNGDGDAVKQTWNIKRNSDWA